MKRNRLATQVFAVTTTSLCWLLGGCGISTSGTSGPASTKPVAPEAARRVATQHLIAKGHASPRLLDVDSSQTSSKLLFEVEAGKPRVLLIVDHKTGKIQSEEIKR